MGKILERVKNLRDVSPGGNSQINMLGQIKNVIATSSKYNTIVMCLKPSFGTTILKNLTHMCLNKHAYDTCGFR